MFSEDQRLRGPSSESFNWMMMSEDLLAAPATANTIERNVTALLNRDRLLELELRQTECDRENL